MEINIIKNLIVIGLTLATGTLAIYILKKIINIGFDWIEKLGNFLVKKFGSKLNYKLSLVFLEIVYIIATIIFIFFLVKGFRFIGFIIYIIIVLVIGSLSHYTRKEKPGILSLLEYLSNKINKRNYFINRLGLILEQGSSILFLMAAIVITLTFLAELRWPNAIYFGSVIVIPLYTNIWIYFTLKLKIRAEEDITNIRRLISYLLLLAIITVDSYFKFNQFFSREGQYEPSESFFIVYIGSIIFIAIDRFLKAFIEDYKKYNNQLK